MKKIFKKPEIEFIGFTASDIIMLSVDPMDDMGSNPDSSYGNIQSGIGDLGGGIGGQPLQ